jgi:primary-amine oxidase
VSFTTRLILQSSERILAFDSHNWPILPRLQTLKRGLDIPGYAETFPVPVPSGDGHGYDIPDAVAVYEQDSDILFRVNEGVIGLGWPNDDKANPTYGAKKRQLVVRCCFSGFYYRFFYSYIFNQDGSMEYYIDLNGQTTNRWVEADATGAHVEGGQRITLQQVAMNHLHTTLWRLDFDIDGVRNQVHEHNYYKDESCETNPCGDVVIEKHTVLKTEKSAARNLKLKRNRMWHCVNPQSKNRLGYARGYMISFYDMNQNAFANELANGAAKTHDNYIKKQFYVTRYHRNEQYGVGEFPTLRDVTTGLDKYIEDDESIDNVDLVVWANSMHFHRPYTEDSAFISSTRSGIKLSPTNFFGMGAQNTLNQVILPNPYTGLSDGSYTYPAMAPIDICP